MGDFVVCSPMLQFGDAVKHLYIALCFVIRAFLWRRRLKSRRALLRITPDGASRMLGIAAQVRLEQIQQALGRGQNFTRPESDDQFRGR